MLVEPSFRLRRKIALFVTATAVGLIALWAWWVEVAQGDRPRMTGYALLASVAILLLIGLRRRLPVLPLGSMSSWTQCHVYVGLFALGVYWLHVPTLLASGTFEFSLSLLFLLVSGSGVYGIYASRSVPKKLSAIERSHPFKQVSQIRKQIARQASELWAELNRPAEMEMLARYYSTNLNPYFSHRPSLSYVMTPTHTRRQRLLDGLSELDRFLETEGRAVANRLATLVRRRADLDYEFAMRLRIRLWLLAHGVLSIALLIGVVIHTLMAVT